ncbi:hypothetical protein BS47DRAFT_1336101, partial [Hydnum rufescens UP504]
LFKFLRPQHPVPTPEPRSRSQVLSVDHTDPGSKTPRETGIVQSSASPMHHGTPPRLDPLPTLSLGILGILRLLSTPLSVLS